MRRVISMMFALLLVLGGGFSALSLSGCEGEGGSGEVKAEDLDPNFGAAIRQTGARAEMEAEKQAELSGQPIPE